MILYLPVALHQVGEIEEQLAAARREVTKSEEANQKLQREVKEVCGVDLQEYILELFCEFDAVCMRYVIVFATRDNIQHNQYFCFL